MFDFLGPLFAQLQDFGWKIKLLLLLVGKNEVW